MISMRALECLVTTVEQGSLHPGPRPARSLIRTRPRDGDAGRRVPGFRTLRARTMTAGG